MQFTLVDLLQRHTVIIPQIQRDYAQGREGEQDLRKSFLKKIKESLEISSPPLNLDFVYGFTKKIGADMFAFVPLDGQQRITTLWLLHWYLAPKNIENVNNKQVRTLSDELRNYLSKFTYETRLSSKRFCNALVANSLAHSPHEKFSALINDAPWFMASWRNDPTIVSMLNMLDAIQEEGFPSETAWQNLVIQKKVTFDYIDIKSEEFKLTDELYIKMNSRGKPLTPFENFKAQFSGLLSSKETNYSDATLHYQNTQVSYQQYFAFSIDSSWIDLFWINRKFVNKSVDNCILSLIYYIAEFLYFRNNANAASQDVKYDFDFLNKVFSEKQNVDFLFKSFDFLSSIKTVSFFDYLFEGLSTFDSHSTNFFLRSISNIGFDVRDKVIFYAILAYCINIDITHPDERLKDFIRIVRNLLLSVRQPNQSQRIEYTTNLRLPNASEYCKFIDGFIKLISANESQGIYEILSTNEFVGFPKENIGFEKIKANLIAVNPTVKQNIFELEEHSMLQGNISNFKIDEPNATDKIKAFKEIWSDKNDDSLIIRAFLTVGDYSVNTHEKSALGEIWYFGSHTKWNRILTAADKKEREKISDALDLFLSKYLSTEGTEANSKLQSLIDNYSEIKRNWQYYFIKYKVITQNPYRKLNLFTWKDDGFNINNLGNSGVHPLSSYHLNPYLIVLQQNYRGNDNVKLFWGRFAYLSHLLVVNYFSITCIADGWKIAPVEGFVISSEIIEKYALVQQGNVHILNETEEKDRIKIATALLDEFLN